MYTELADFIKDTPEGNIANTILSKCVHCGFCTATCPTYQLTNDELDGPRGRIYQIKSVLEGTPATKSVQEHLDRCLTCRNCETTCPSGVEYGKLVEIGREVVEKQLPRTGQAAFKRKLLRKLILNPALFNTTYRMGQNVKSMLPAALSKKIMAKKPALAPVTQQHEHKVIMLAGCVQPTMSPNINLATARVLDKLNVTPVMPSNAGCCGAINLHMSEHEAGLDDMRRNIDAWIPLLNSGVKAIIINASGCGATVKEYGYHLQNDANYQDKANRISEAAMDIVEYLETRAQDLLELMPAHTQQATLAYHPPCSLQHGMKLGGRVEMLLHKMNINVCLPHESNLCCGSAGTYSFFQPEFSEQLRDRKLGNLDELKPDVILSANIGCIAHLQSATQTPVEHWVEYLDRMLSLH